MINLWTYSIIPQLENKDLSYLSCVSRDLRIIALPIIKERAEEEWKRLNFEILLHKKIGDYIVKHTDLREYISKQIDIITKTITLLNFYQQSLIKFFYFSCSKSCPQDVINFTKENLSILNSREMKTQFYSELDCEANFKSHCIKLIEAYEVSEEKRGFGRFSLCAIDISRVFLSTGNQTCFSLFRKQLLNKNSCILSSTSLEKHNHANHKTIILFSNKHNVLNQHASPELLHQLETEVASLKGLELLEIRVEPGSYASLVRSCLSSILKSTENLSELKGLYFCFRHKISDLCINDLCEYIKTSLVSSQFHMLRIDSFSITWEQIRRLIDNLNVSKATFIHLDIVVPRRCPIIPEKISGKVKLTLGYVTQ